LSSIVKMNYFTSLLTLEFSVFQEEHTLRIYPNWMVRYFDSLTKKEQWQYFLEYRKVADQMLSEQYFIDQLKWILKHSSIELEYDLYVQAMLDPDFCVDDVFKSGKFNELNEKYSQRFKKDFSPVFEQSESLASLLNGQGDTLPF
jgi:hypothetical protein